MDWQNILLTALYCAALVCALALFAMYPMWQFAALAGALGYLAVVSITV